jgi:hypothetical protein
MDYASSKQTRLAKESYDGTRFMLEVKKPRSIEKDYLPFLPIEPKLRNPFTTARRVILDIIFRSNCLDRAANHYDVIYTKKLYGRYGYTD